MPMPMRRPARRPRRKVAPKPRRRVRRTGTMASNTKVDERVQYRIRSLCQPATASVVPGTTYLWLAFSPQNGNYSNVTNSAEFTAQSKMFDEFCVTGMKVQYKPYVNQVPSTAITAQVNKFDSYTFIDRDGQVPVSTSVDVPTKLLAYDSCRVGKIYKGWTRNIKLGRFWCDCSAPTLNPQVTPASQPWNNAGLMQVVGFYAEQMQFPASYTVGEIITTFSVSFRGKKTTSFGYDPVSGSIILTPITSYPALAVLNPPLTEEQTLLADEQCECGETGLVITSNIDGSVATKLVV